MKTNQAICRRCGKAFTPQPTNLKSRPMTTFCKECGLRNFLDSLDLPTPPDFLDRYTKHPTLTKDEFKTKMASEKAEDE